MKTILFALILLTSSLALAGKVEPITERTEPPGVFDPKDFVKVAAVAVNPVGLAPVPATFEQAERYKQGNRLRLAERIREAAAKGAEIIVTPEFGITGYPDIEGLPPEEDNFRNREDIFPYVEPVLGTSYQFFSQLARELGVFIHYGLATAEAPNAPFYNTVVVVNPEGKVVAAYDKVSLYHAEVNFLVPGKGPVAYESPAGVMGLLICADTYYGPILKKYLGKVDVMALSTSWAHYNTGMDNFIRTAQYLKVFYVAANQMYFPDSGVINPDGSRQSHIRQSEVTAYGYFPRKTKRFR